MKTVIVTPQIPIAFKTGGIGTFTENLTRLLRAHGDEVQIIFTHRPEVPRSEWQGRFRELEVPVVCIDEDTAPLIIPTGYDRLQAISEAVAQRLPKDAAVVYFADWEANGLHYVRQRRFVANEVPACVTVLHGSSKWNRWGMQLWPESTEELALDFQERYAVEHSDFVAAPSQYIVSWAQDDGWVLPPSDRVQVLGLPFLPNPDLLEQLGPSSQTFDRIAFFGRQDTCKGIDLFVESLIGLSNGRGLESIREIVLLGAIGQNVYGSRDDIVGRLRSHIPGVGIAAYTDLTSVQAQRFLAENASRTLVVIPSRADTLGYSAIEASLINNLNIICSNAGGIPEIFGSDDCDQLFDPYVESLTEKIDQWLQAGPRDSSRLGKYDWAAANQRWLAFHDKVCAYARSVQSPDGPGRQNTQIITPSAKRRANVDVCIPYYNHGQYLPHLLTSLEAQTSQDFNVFVVNDGSTDIRSITNFEGLAEQYQQRANWTFISTDHKGACHARNFAASLGTTELICFVDADSITLPNMIERFVEGILKSGDDCLTCNRYCFANDSAPLTSSRVLRRPVFHSVPIGNCPSLGVVQNPYGDGTCVIRRSVFEQLGGFVADRPNDTNYEYRELFARLSLAGYHLDVIPEFLLNCRLRTDSGMRTGGEYQNESRVARHYEAKLREVGLADLVALLLGQHHAASRRAGQDIPALRQQIANLEQNAAKLEEQITSSKARVGELEEAVRWHKLQSDNWEKAAAEQQAQMAAEHAWIAELQMGAEWHRQQSQNWEKAAAERESQFAELQSWTIELQEAVEWHKQQSLRWEALAAEREAHISELLAQPKTAQGKVLDSVKRMWAMLRRAGKVTNLVSKE